MPEAGGGEVWAMPIPRCPTHGRMRLNMPMDRWECVGWDGEGCSHSVTVEAQLEQACPIGRTAEVTGLDYPLQSPLE